MAALLCEKAVNGWVLEFYIQRAVQAFREGRHQDFGQFRNIIFAVSERPVDLVPGLFVQLRVIQLLSWIEQDWDIGIRTRRTPLESALQVLKMMRDEFPVEANKFDEIRQEVVEAEVVGSIKNEAWDRAERVLWKFRPQDPRTQERRVLYEHLIREKQPSHPAIMQFSFQTFQQNVLGLLEGYLEDSEPFLSTVAERYPHEPAGPQMIPIAGGHVGA